MSFSQVRRALEEREQGDRTAATIASLHEAAMRLRLLALKIRQRVRHRSILFIAVYVKGLSLLLQVQTSFRMALY